MVLSDTVNVVGAAVVVVVVEPAIVTHRYIKADIDKFSSDILHIDSGLQTQLKIREE